MALHDLLDDVQAEPGAADARRVGAALEPAEQPLAVEGRVGVSDVEGKVNVQLRNAAKSILPIP